MNNKIEVKTQFGMLCAEIGGDPENYPEIFIYLKNKNGTEIDLCAVGTKKDETRLSAYLWADTSTYDYTDRYNWKQEEFNWKEQEMIV